MIRSVKLEDAKAIAQIYNHYVNHSIITFEEDEVSVTDIRNRIEQKGNYPWIVYEKDQQLIGYAYAAQWKSRSAYRFTVESSIYLEKACTRRGVGSQLYRHLLAELGAAGYKKVLAGIALPNEQSVKFHEALGFKKVGQLERVGIKFGEWIDVGYWEIELA